MEKGGQQAGSKALKLGVEGEATGEVWWLLCS